MKLILTLLFAYSIMPGIAQTPLISHKSHAGTSATFFMDPNTNFGIPSPRLVQVVRLNDSTSIEISDHYNGYYQYDTVYNNPFYANYDLNIDSFQKKNYSRRVEYINFKRSSDSLKQKPPGLDQQKLYQEIAPQPEIQKEEIPPTKKKKKSYLLFLFGITGGGMLLMRLFSRSKISKPSIAQL